FFTGTATTEVCTLLDLLSLHDALPIYTVSARTKVSISTLRAYSQTHNSDPNRTSTPLAPSHH
ncbi:hypothetical protein ACUH78_20125, partial [Thauera sp. ZXT1-4]|uniref:hypothetical protein n=1 Tax=Thauera sp. ZXT1-4 TaxID=3460294 RepID=UPI004040BCFC